MAYGDHDGTPSLSQQVTYVLSQDEYNKYGVQSVTATITFISTTTCVNLTATVKGVTLSELNVTYDSSGSVKRSWYVSLGAPVPTGSPW